jgi:hypothetical protein
MSPNAEAFHEAGGVGRTPMSAKEVRRAEVLSRVKVGTLGDPPEGLQAIGIHCTRSGIAVLRVPLAHTDV